MTNKFWFLYDQTRIKNLETITYMSRISRYQDSVTRFIKQRSCLSTLEPDLKNKILEMTDECDHVISILLLTVMNSQSHKSSMTINGYYIASGIEMMLYSVLINDNKDYYTKKFGKDHVNEILSRISGMVNICLSHNLELLQGNFTGTNYTKLLKLIHNITRQLNSGIYKLTIDPQIILGDNIIKTDATKYKFNNINIATQQIIKLKRVNSEKINKYVTDKYGFICQQALIVGWLLGGGDEKLLLNIEKLGMYFAYMVKCVQDFTYIERDLEHATSYTHNIISYILCMHHV